MLLLRSSQMLQTLEGALRKGIPESLKDMTDDLDHYTNTYQVFSKDFQNCQEILKSSDVINWKQHLQIQGLQSDLNEVINNVAEEKSVQVTATHRYLYLISETMKKHAPSQQNLDQLYTKTEKPKTKVNTEIYKMSSLEPQHASLVNDLWSFGGNERSLKFIQRCIQHFPSYCLLGPEGTPVSWNLMDQTGELRMAGTLPEYRRQGLISHIIYQHIQDMDKKDYPMYSHIAKDNLHMQQMIHSLKLICATYYWQQWNCEPLRRSATEDSESQSKREGGSGGRA
ncbi:glycine N-acyltransferase-like isoform X2 [Phascolarctos cinereus]|uniref:Glycine N-acyltransferase-like protein n=1 Tax=Phascolarctos cinereus TaxID=38626 RepID=A0A6P5JL13_PHACI|nr:glycine N-acyltransferase-like isoform X2 [Phascolarctos cinereus]